MEWSRQEWIFDLYSATDNYIASNGGSTNSISRQHRAGPKARTEGRAMFREDHVRNLLASSKDTRLLSEHPCVRLSVSTCNIRWPVSCGYASSGEVLGHPGRDRLGKTKGHCTMAVVGE